MDGRIYFANNWMITLPYSARKIFSTAIILAKAEGGAPNHIKSLEARLPQLKPDSKYRVGRLKNGVQIAEVVNK